MPDVIYTIEPTAWRLAVAGLVLLAIESLVIAVLAWRLRKH